MRYATVCSGIEAPSVAWHPLGWSPAFFSEIDRFPCAVLEQRWPGVPNLGDMTKFAEWPDAAFDVLCGGTPCQSFSVAGLRKGLDDPRGNLMLTYLAIAARFRPRWLVWENVPGVLSVDAGRAFGALLGGMGQLGYGFAYRVLDAQYFGVPQRRRRVFVVGCFGDWRAAAAVLFERHSLQGHPAPRREAREGIAVSPTLRAGGNSTGGDRPPGTDVDTADSLIVAHSLNGNSGRMQIEATYLPTLAHSVRAQAQAQASHREDSDTYVTHSLRADGFDASEDGTGRGTPIIPIQSVQAVREKKQNGIGIGQPGEEMYTLTGRDQHAVAFTQNQREEVRELSVAGALGAIRRGDAKNETLLAAMAVRRLTPRECERLQGFPPIRERVKMTVCLDRPNGVVSVGLSCLKWLGNASPADAEKYPRDANAAGESSSINPVSSEPLAAVSVLTNSVDELLEIRSHGRLTWCASNAGASSAFRLPTLSGAIAATLAPLLRDLARAIQAGRAASLRNINLSFQASAGARNALRYGAGSVEPANAAMSDVSRGRFTTSALGALAPTCDSPIAISLCSALAVISGCIPSETLPERFSLELDVETPYTLIDYRGKPATDGPRYKALGNSMAVPVIAWLGKRIDAADAITQDRREA